MTRAYAWSLAPAARRFEAACHDPSAAQRQRLQAVLREVRGSRRWGDLEAEGFRRLEPTTYEDYRGDIQALMDGHDRVLTRSPVLRFEASGGTTGVGKWLPMTQPFLAEVQAGVDAWLHRLYRDQPRLHGRRAYWSLTPGGDVRQTAAGIPMGGSDSDYLGAFARLAWRQLMAVPDDVARSEDWLRDTLRALVKARDLALVSVWSPTLWMHLLDGLEAEQDLWLQDLPMARRRRIEEHGGPLWQAVWPRLRVVSCWTEGQSAMHAEALRRRMPGVHVQGKGLLATEGVVTVPYRGNVAVPNGHVLEFERDGDILPLHAIEPGHTYTVLLSTSAGLLRYRLGDRVEVTGHHGRTPKLAFLGRDRVTDLVGEKLHDAWVEACWAEASAGLDVGFALMAPRADRRGYALFAEHHAQRCAERLEHALRRDHGYDHARARGQLQSLQGRTIRDGLARWQEACVAQGQRLGDLKPTVIDARPIWEEAFRVEA